LAAPRLGTATPRHPLRATWLAVALQAFFRGDAVRDLTASVELVLPTGTLALNFSRGKLRVSEGTADAPAARLFTTEQKFVDLLRRRTGRRGRDKRDLRVEGDESIVDRLIAAFPLVGESAGEPV
jgi:hypothetical protein